MKYERAIILEEPNPEERAANCENPKADQRAMLKEKPTLSKRLEKRGIEKSRAIFSPKT